MRKINNLNDLEKAAKDKKSLFMKSYTKDEVKSSATFMMAQSGSTLLKLFRIGLYAND